jgi:hypothetical protein
VTARSSVLRARRISILAGGLVSVEQWPQEPVLEFAVEDCEVDAVGYEDVGVAAWQPVG